jgi:hypothetical protein
MYLPDTAAGFVTEFRVSVTIPANGQRRELRTAPEVQAVTVAGQAHRSGIDRKRTDLRSVCKSWEPK